MIGAVPADLELLDEFDTVGPPLLSRFELHRHVDPTGVSGQGVIADGVVWDDGKAVLRWRDCNGHRIRQTTVHDSVHEIEQIHGHHGSTVIRWLDDPPLAARRRS